MSLSGTIDLFALPDPEDQAAQLREQYVQLWLLREDHGGEAFDSALNAVALAYDRLCDVVALEEHGETDESVAPKGAEAEAVFREAWIENYRTGLGADRAYAEESWCVFDFDWRASGAPADLLEEAGKRLGRADAARTRQALGMMRTVTASA